MEDNAQNQAISSWGSLVAIVLLVIFIFTVFMAARSGIQKQVNKMTDTIAVANESTFTVYEAQDIKGSQVVSLLGMWENEAVCIHVINKAGNEIGPFNYTDDTLQNKVDPDTVDKGYLDADNAKYINPNGNFYCSITRDEGSGAIVAVTFDQRGKQP